MFESGYTDMRIRVSFAPIDFPYSDDRHRDNVYNILPTVASQLRANYRADLVMLSTTVNYSDAVRGAANVGPYDDNGVWAAPCFDCAYGIAEIRFMGPPRWTLAHEIAHLFSARHNDDGSGEDCGHGYRFKEEVGANRTLMHRLIDGEPESGHSRVLVFSTPEVSIENVTIGTEDYFNNALLINNAACKVEVIDSQGRTIVSKHNSAAHQTVDIEVANLTPGLYYLRLVSPTGNFVSSFTKVN